MPRWHSVIACCLLLDLLAPLGQCYCSLSQLRPRKADLVMSAKRVNSAVRTDRPAGRTRRPRGYWRNQENLTAEVIKFWTSRGINSKMVPNEMLMQHLGEHGLRHGLYSNGGAEGAAFLLGSSVMPGRWSEALETEEVQALLQTGQLEVKGHIPRPRRRARPRGYWYERSNLATELYAALKELHEAGDKELPMVWMPRMQALQRAGKADLVQSINRNGGPEGVAKQVNVVPYGEWGPFLCDYRCLAQLQEYIRLHGTHGSMPRLKDMVTNGYSKLRDSIARMGGRKLVAAKMDLLLEGSASEYLSDGSIRAVMDGNVQCVYGRFDLDFAVSLMEQIMDGHRARVPGETSSESGAADSCMYEVALPSRSDLLQAGREDLVSSIEEYGGWENVARRMQVSKRAQQHLNWTHASGLLDWHG
ncbi:unnamed protein product [Chrysoparadoxa australica]